MERREERREGEDLVPLLERVLVDEKRGKGEERLLLEKRAGWVAG